MEITKEVLMNTKRECEAKRDKLLAEINVIQGQIGMLSGLLMHLEREPDTEKAN